jgi:hypothetical protein
MFADGYNGITNQSENPFPLKFRQNLEFAYMAIAMVLKKIQYLLCKL